MGKNGQINQSFLSKVYVLFREIGHTVLWYSFTVTAKVNSKLKCILFDCGEIDGNVLLVSREDGSTGD